MPHQSVEVTANTSKLLDNNVLSNTEFPENLKIADVTPIFRDKDPLA